MTSGGYWASAWPVECGAAHRPQVADGTGLELGPTDRLVASTRHIDAVPLMLIQRDPGELYLLSLNDDGDTGASVERVDPVTLETRAASGPLEGGRHHWPGSIAAHRNGDLYLVAGSYVHRLDSRCGPLAHVPLPVDRPHDGLAILGDGSLVTKDARLGAGPSTLSVLTPDLEVVDSMTLPEPSLGRLAVRSETGRRRAGELVDDSIYIAGSTRLFRYRWDGVVLREDHDWRPTYRRADSGGMAGDLVVTEDRVWLMTNASVPDVERLLAPSPTRDAPAEGDVAVPSWTEPVRLLGFDRHPAGSIGENGRQATDAPAASTDPVRIAPTELPVGWAVSPPLVHDAVVVGWDSGNTGLAAFDLSPGARREMLWYQPFRSSMRPLLFPTSGELVTNDFRYLESGATSDDVVVIDLATGRMKARVETGATGPSRMFLTPGWDRDLYYCGGSPGTGGGSGRGVVARIRVGG